MTDESPEFEAERQLVRQDLVRAGLLPDETGSAPEISRVNVALDLLQRVREPAAGTLREEIEAVQAQMVRMKGQLATESERARVAERAAREQLEQKMLGERAQKQLEHDLERATAERERLERQVSALVDHERVLIRFTDRLREVEAALQAEILELRGRLAVLEREARSRALATERQRKRRGRQLRALRQLGGVLLLIFTTAFAVLMLRRGVDHTVRAWTTMGVLTSLGVVAGAFLILGRRRGVHVLASTVGALDLLLNFVNQYGQRR